MSDGELLEAMINAALDAGRAVQEIYRRDSWRALEVRTKADSSPVTLADRTAEGIVLEHLARCAAGTPVIAEEEVAAGRVPAVGEEFFLVDPLDGTKEFIARRGEFTVNIALVRRGAPVLGVVYAPPLGRLYAGNVTSPGAFRSTLDLEEPRVAARESIHVRAVPAGGITAVASRSHSSAETEAYLARYRVAERISIGSSLKFCLIAEGHADLYPRLGTTMEWDTAAGHAVLLGAGGSVTCATGGALGYGKPQFRNPWFIASGALAPQPIEG
ncbi:MAG TPA: 3'(2'),5'-bisphosphate nucleotidase CysQ [Steroidobacteraceae bacterium]|nr:3'(2'),5'-bisphosphate nucleotidase CysQ [Steroidobacteraceae bacterium]